MLENGYDPDIHQGHFNWTALTHCIRPGQSMLRYDQKYEMIKMLLEHGANPNVDCLNEPAMHMLIMYHKDNPYVLDIVEMFIKAGYDLNRIHSGRTALELALGQGPADIAFLLLEHTEEINAVSQFGSPLIVTASYNNPKCVELLMSRGVDLNVTDRNGNTPLHAAARGRNAEIVSMLLDAGLAVNPLNDENQTPLDRAMQQDSCRPDEIKPERIVSLLIQHGAKTAAQLKGTN